MSLPEVFPQSSSNPASCLLVFCRIWVLIIGFHMYLHSWVKRQLFQWEELGRFVIILVHEKHRGKKKIK